MLENNRKKQCKNKTTPASWSSFSITTFGNGSWPQGHYFSFSWDI